MEFEVSFLTNQTNGLFQSRTRTPTEPCGCSSINMVVPNRINSLLSHSSLYEPVEWISPRLLTPPLARGHMEPKRAFAERLRVVESRRIHESAGFRGIVEFEDGDRYRFITDQEISEKTWHTVVGTFEEEHGEPIVLIEEIQ